MIALLTLINVLLLFTGLYAVVKKTAVDNSNPVQVITAAIMLISFISYFYYLMLVLNCGYIMLIAFLSIVNLSHIYFSVNFLFKNSKKQAITFNSGLWALLMIFLFTCYFAVYGSKYGGTDAWAIWNLHAKFLYYEDSWRSLFTTNLAFSHPDYPLMLPSVIAFLWHGINAITPTIPTLFTYVILLTIPLLIYYAFLEEGLKLYALLAIVIFIADNNYKQIATSQEADSLLSLFILLVFVLYKKTQTAANNNGIYLLGFVCASCGWIKNEGMVFFLLFSIGYVLFNFKNIQLLKKYFTGIIIPVMVIISFKLFFAPANDVISLNNGHLSSMAAFTTANRYIMIFKFGVNVLLTNYMYLLILLLTIVVVNRKSLLSFPFLILLLLLTAYFIVYLITPHDLNWHLSTSLYRLFQHIYPAFVYLGFLSLKKTDPYISV